MNDLLIAVCPKCRTKNRVSLARAHDSRPVCGKCGGGVFPLMPGYPVETSDAAFESDVVRSGVPTLVDFYSTSCGPCRMMEPVVARLAEDLAGQVRIVKLNTDRAPYTASRYRIEGVPTFVLFRGVELGRAVGAQPAEALLRLVERHRTPA